MKLPDEDRLRDHIQLGLAEELRLASELLRLGTDLFNDGPTLNTNDVPGHDELWLCLGIVAKACRQYRAVVAMVELGLGDVAQSNCRMLVETSLAAQFLMQPTVKLRKGKKEIAEIPGYPLTTEFRTKLYLANDALSTAKVLREMAKDGGLYSDNDDEILRGAEQHAKEQCDPIGPEWTKRLKDTHSYSGLGIVDLAESFGRSFVYNAVYRPANASVHGADARKSVNLDAEDEGVCLTFVTGPQGVAEALAWASHLLLDVLQIASIRFGLGLEERTSLVRARVRGMKHELQ